MDSIVIRGARQHNLKNVSLSIPRNALVVLTGVSGSGKSSLAFDTLFAEGQRRYVESLSAYARQFLEQMEKPDVDSIEGLSPAISIEQKTTSKNPRSTVGTVTEIYDYLRLLFASIGQPHCVSCGREISAQTIQQMTDRILAMPEGTRFLVLAPFVRGKKGEYRRQMAEFAKQGFVRARVNGEMVDLAEPARARQAEEAHDRGRRRPPRREARRRDAPPPRRLARDRDEGGERPRDDRGRRRQGGDATPRRRSRRPTPAPTAGRPSPRSRRASSPSTRPSGPAPPARASGRCRGSTRTGSSRTRRCRSREGRSPSGSPGSANWRLRQIEQLAKAAKFSMDVPWKKLPNDVRDMILHGSEEREIKWKWKSEKGEYVWSSSYKGLVPILTEKYKEVESEEARPELEKFMSATPCPDCGGRRLKPEALAVKVRGRAIDALTGLTLEDAKAFFATFEADAARAGDRREDPEGDRRPARLPERRRHRLPLPRARLGDALRRRGAADPARHADRLEADGRPLRPRRALDRPPPEGQPQAHRHARRRCATSGTRSSSSSTTRRRSARPTVSSTSAPAPGSTAARSSGEGKADELVRFPRSLTGKYLSGELSIAGPGLPPARGAGRRSRVVGATANNLQNVTVRFPLGVFTAVTGVSGSGKSTLVNDILYRAAARVLHESTEKPGAHERIEGLEHLDKVIDIDQSPIGRTPRSNPATYTNLFDPIRDLMAQVPGGADARLRPGALLLQREGGALRDLRRRRADRHRDALPARHLRHLRRLRRAALQPRDARGPLQGAQHRRRPRPDGRAGGRGLRERPVDPERRGRRSTTSASATSSSGSRRRPSRGARRSA